MSRFNSAATDQTRTKNLVGGEAYTIGSEMELYTTVCTASLNNKFYESSKGTIDRVRSLIAQCDPEFVARLAVYVREEMNLRTIPLVLTVELAKTHNGDDLISRLTERVIQRVDELTEILAYYQLVNNRIGTKKLGKLSNQLQKGIANAFNKFDRYQFGKWSRDTEIKIRDVLFLSHPKPKDEEQKRIFKKIVDGTLETPYTWETRLSEAGQNGESKKEVWEELIESRKVGYMALMRNLRNIIQAEVSDEHITMVCNYLSNETAVLNSKQLPFRYVSAYRMLTTGKAPTISFDRWDDRDYTYREYTNSVVDDPRLGQILQALEVAINISVQNIPMFDHNENVLIATDVSGSMCQPVSERSVINYYDIGAILAMMIHKKVTKSVTGLFGDHFETLAFPKDNILQNAQQIYELEGKVGYSTHGYKVIEYANNSNYKFDRIMIFTDTQMYGGSLQQEWNIYKTSNPNAKLYIFDINGYGISPLTLRDNNVYLIAGWNEAVFKILESLDDGYSAIDSINSISL